MRLKKKLKPLYRPVVALLLRGLARTVQAMPRRLALRFGEMLGGAAWKIFGRDRRLALANLRLVFGGTRPRREIHRIARECFRTVGRSAVETMRMSAMTGEEIASLVDADSFAPAERVLARGKGLVGLSAHIGAWEFLGAYLVIRLGKPVYAVGRRLYFGPYNELLVSNRRSVGIETVFQDEGARRALRVLKSKRPLIVLADHDVAHLGGVFVEFLGRPAYTPTAPVGLARASGAGIVPVFVTWKGLRHRVHVLPEVELVRTGDRRADAVENTRRWTRAVEHMIRRYPEHWVWFHRRWRQAPAEKPDAEGQDSQDGSDR